MERRFLITAGLPYSNGPIHLGHVAGAHLPADIFARYARSRGDEVLFVSGSDDHGVAALLAAEAAGEPVAALSARYSARQEEALRKLSISYDVYGGTARPLFA